MLCMRELSFFACKCLLLLEYRFSYFIYDHDRKMIFVFQFSSYFNIKICPVSKLIISKPNEICPVWIIAFFLLFYCRKQINSCLYLLRWGSEMKNNFNKENTLMKTLCQLPSIIKNIPDKWRERDQPVLYVAFLRSTNILNRF